MALPGGDVGRRLLLLVDDGGVGVGLEDDADELPAAHGGGDVQRGVAVLKRGEGSLITIRLESIVIS